MFLMTVMLVISPRPHLLPPLHFSLRLPTFPFSIFSLFLSSTPLTPLSHIFPPFSNLPFQLTLFFRPSSLPNFPPTPPPLPFPYSPRFSPCHATTSQQISLYLPFYHSTFHPVPTDDLLSITPSNFILLSFPLSFSTIHILLLTSPPPCLSSPSHSPSPPLPSYPPIIFPQLSFHHSYIFPSTLNLTYGLNALHFYFGIYFHRGDICWIMYEQFYLCPQSSASCQ
jgi:hypothetical protein